MEKHVYTISPLFSFAGTLAETLLDENKNDPMRLAKTLILMPTKRACLMLHKAFLQKTKGRPVLLPRIVSFASLESEDSAQTFLTAPLASLPEAIDPTQRLMLLTRLIMQWRPDMRESAASAQARNRNKQAEAQAPRYSNKVDAYRRANVQSGRRERG